MVRSKPIHERSLTELRGIAQSMGVTDIFEKDAKHLIQEIQIKQAALTPPPAPLPPLPPYDARLMLKPPSKRCDPLEAVKLLEPYIAIGLKFSFDENAERWMMSHGKRTDEGTLRMPLRTLLDCARRMMAS